MLLEIVRRYCLIGVIRAADESALVPAAEAIANGGVRVVEFSYTGPGVLEALKEARDKLPADLTLGAGTVLDAPTAYACIEAGAQYIVSPTFKQETMTACKEAGIPTIPGAATPTEIQRAWEAGASLVKVFPAAVLGPRFFSDVSAILPQIPMAAFGGISLEYAHEYLNAGAIAVGVATGLVGTELSLDSDWDSLTDRARAFVAAVSAELS